MTRVRRSHAENAECVRPTVSACSAGQPNGWSECHRHELGLQQANFQIARDPLEIDKRWATYPAIFCPLWWQPAEVGFGYRWISMLFAEDVCKRCDKRETQ
jgi:hypothetical protein